MAEKAIHLLDHNNVPFVDKKDTGKGIVPTFLGKKEQGLAPKAPARCHNSLVAARIDGAQDSFGAINQIIDSQWY